jgi:hypothetical protein
MPREDASAVIMGIIGLSLLSLSCPSPLRQELVRNIYPTAAPVCNPFSITSLRQCQQRGKVKGQLRKSSVGWSVVLRVVWLRWISESVSRRAALLGSLGRRGFRPGGHDVQQVRAASRSSWTSRTRDPDKATTACSRPANRTRSPTDSSRGRITIPAPFPRHPVRRHPRGRRQRRRLQVDRQLPAPQQVVDHRKHVNRITAGPGTGQQAGSTREHPAQSRRGVLPHHPRMPEPRQPPQNSPRTRDPTRRPARTPSRPECTHPGFRRTSPRRGRRSGHPA